MSTQKPLKNMVPSNKMTSATFKKFAFILLIYTLLVILWGAWVRISHSGDGCGDTWPLCHGKLIPEAEQGKTWVEFGHRIMSGIYGFIVIYFWWVSRRLYPKGHFARLAALLALIFTISEALLGAKLVLFKLVTTNDTHYRAFVMALHQINSFLLTGAIAFAYAASETATSVKKRVSGYPLQNYFPYIIILIGITGAWASLSNTLFPTENLLQGLFADFDNNSHFLIKLRGLHPLFATLGAGGLAIFFWLRAQNEGTPEAANEKALQYSKASLRMVYILVAGIFLGYLTLFTHAPVVLKITHLAYAHFIWVNLLIWLYRFKEFKA